MTVAIIMQCDQCRKATTTPGPHELEGWLRGHWHHDDEECGDVDFCSWRCMAEYATARALIDSPPQLPGTAES